ncbi:Sir2 family NAD-dependent protein deacetylase [Gordonia jinhuaensis]|uniref:Sir2 family NAD-dependent protein deacetylase n=1 Tax=Gordonia jinhuaensis TaxID=1517702 RepID=UPI00166E5F35|nr:Sir2 family NAD-dependent protein deacetylase [Gordonia jinhuaensis]
MRVRQDAWLPGEATSVDTDFTQRVEQLRHLLDGRRVIALTGAGMSTDSGIPDYRSPHAKPRTPMTIQMYMSAPEFRRHYWARNHLGWRHMDAARPNSGHLALTAMQRQGRLHGVITQNVDMLHIKAGSSPVIELHGSYGRVLCANCGWHVSRYRLHEMLEPLNVGFEERVRGDGAIEVAPDADMVLSETDDFTMIDCPRCGGILRPDIVYFGETVPADRVARAYRMVDDADAVLVLGSSLTVMSGFRFARRAHDNGKALAVVNRGHTRADAIADLKIDHHLSQVLTTLAGPDASQSAETAPGSVSAAAR